MSTIPAVKLLIGAPLATALRWDPEDLTAELLPCFRTDPSVNVGRDSDAVPDPSIRPQWRQLSLKREHLKTGLTQASQQEWQPEDEETSFLDTRELSLPSKPHSQEQEEELPKLVISQFLEHSFALHEEIPSSQLQGISESPTISFTSSFTSSTSHSSSYSLPSLPSPRLVIPRANQITNLNSIPNTFHISSIIPQTITVNLIVGIISLPQSRTIVTRKGGRILELIEMTVGDETKAGFGINLWLGPASTAPPPIDQQQQSTLRDIAATLRPKDIILARNVALSSFRGNVYGQSLRKEVTKIDLLYRNLVDRTDVGGVYRASDLRREGGDEQVEKVKRVRDWVTNFVGVPDMVIEQKGGDVGDGRARKRARILPDDTQ